MKNVSMLAWLHVVALALAGLPLLMLATPASAQDSATVSSSNFNPPPCDYSDTFYEDNGIVPTQVVGRFGTSRRTGPPARGNQVNWVADSDLRRATTPSAGTSASWPLPAGSPTTARTRPTSSSPSWVSSPARALSRRPIRVLPALTTSRSATVRTRAESAMEDIVSNFEAYAMVKQRLPNGQFATNPCDTDMASPLAPPTPCFQLNTVNTVFTPNLRQDWRFASNRNAMDGSDNNCISTDPTVCASPSATARSATSATICWECGSSLMSGSPWIRPTRPPPSARRSSQALEAKNGASLDGSSHHRDRGRYQQPDRGQWLRRGGASWPSMERTAAQSGWFARPFPIHATVPSPGTLSWTRCSCPTDSRRTRQMTANFVSLQTTGQFPGGGDGSVPGSP